MAHCGSCKSKLGTGFLPTMMKKTSKRFGSGAVPMTAIALAESGGMQSSGMTKALRTVWIAAVTSASAGPIGEIWAVYTGGKRAKLYVAGKEQIRRVLEIRNGGATGVEVRLGVPVLAFGTGGCQRPKPGTGQQHRRHGQGYQTPPSRSPTYGTGADRPTHTSWSSAKGTVGPYSSGHQGQIDIASVDYGAQGEGAAVGYYALGTAGARNEELALAASSGPRHLRRR